MVPNRALVNVLNNWKDDCFQYLTDSSEAPRKEKFENLVAPEIVDSPSAPTIKPDANDENEKILLELRKWFRSIGITPDLAKTYSQTMLSKGVS